MASKPSNTGFLSAIVCTYDRADLLGRTLESLCQQTLEKSGFEVVVVDDGSRDHTPDVVRSFESRLPLRFSRQRNAGLASARNHGLFLARGEILLFLDDDDVADPGLLAAHVEAHRRFPEPHVGVLGHTRLDPAIAADPLMHFVTEVGCFLFSYPALKEGELLDFDHFWGGRSSCKRSFLLHHGVFNPVFRFGCEDIELAFRLSRHGFKVVYAPRAVSTTVRPIGFDDFCHRLFRQGQSNFVFSTLHADPAVEQWTEVSTAAELWSRVGPAYETIVGSARRLDGLARARLAAGLPLDEADTSLLHRGYWAAFRASKAKGIVERAAEMGRELPAPPKPRSTPGPSPIAVSGPAFSSPALTTFLGEVPAIHGGGTVTYGLSEDALRFIDAHVTSGSRTLETGSGVSTLLFVFKGAAHTCVTPASDEVERLKAYCHDRGVSTANLTFLAEKSQTALPRADLPELDLVLIDGGHGFPVPFVDWFFLAPRLKTGGIVIVDDTQLWTGEILRDFLLAEPEWRLEARFVRGAAFRKVGDRVEKEWNEQPYVFERSESPGRPRPASVR